MVPLALGRHPQLVCFFSENLVENWLRNFTNTECVAELCGRPLYPITCGDLGITAVEVESRLKRIFVQALRWKCVLLLDEVLLHTQFTCEVAITRTKCRQMFS